MSGPRFLGYQSFTTAASATTFDPSFNVGEIFTDGSGNFYRYVKAGGTITVGNAVSAASSATPFSAVVVYDHSSVNGNVIGVAMVSASSSKYFFIQIGGVTAATTTLESASVAPGDPLRGSGTTDGRFDKAAATDIANACGYCLTDGGSNAGVVLLQGLF